MNKIMHKNIYFGIVYFFFVLFFDVSITLLWLTTKPTTNSGVLSPYLYRMKKNYVYLLLESGILYKESKKMSYLPNVPYIANPGFPDTEKWSRGT